MKNLEDVLNECNKEKFVFVQPGGNYGDYLIYFGAEVLAKRLGITFETISIHDFVDREPDDSDVYIHGGGGFNEWCSGTTFDCLSHATKQYSGNVIYGPCTTSINLEFLQTRFAQCLGDIKSKRVVIFAREQLTFDLLPKIPAVVDNCEIYLDHDTALHLTKDDLLACAGIEKDAYCLYGYRIDNEASNVKHKDDCLRVVLDPPMFAKSFEHWVRLHAHANKIITNRTHSSIAGAILGKDTTLFASKYHKNNSVWHYSLKDMGVHWAEDNLATTIAKTSWLSKLIPNKFHASYKIQQLAKRLIGVPLK